MEEERRRVLRVPQDLGSCVATPLSSARPAHLARTALDTRHHVEVQQYSSRVV